MKKHKWLAVAIVGTVMTIGTLHADDTADAIASLKKQIEVLNAKVQQLENEHRAEVEAKAAAHSSSTPANTSSSPASAAAKSKAPFITAGEDGFTMQSADTNFTLRLHGMGQLDGHYYASPNPGAKDTFTMRRLRAVASGTVYKDYDYFMQTDFGAGNLSTPTNNSLLLDAYADIHYWPEFQIRGGKFRSPVGLEIQPADENLPFVERAFPTQLVPNRDAGAEFKGDLFGGALSYAVGAFNGLPDGASGDVSVADNQKNVAGRLFALPFKNTQFAGLKGFGVGVGGSYGFDAGSATPSFSTFGRQKFFSYAGGAGTAASPSVSESGSHFRLVPQGYYNWGPAGFYWEYAISSEKFRRDAGPKPTYAFFDNTAWNVAASWFLTGEKNAFGKPPAPLHPFRIDGSGLGAWQITARIGELSLDKSAFPLYAAKGSAQDAVSWAIGLNWYMNKYVKWILEYDQTTFGFDYPGGKPAAGSVAAHPEKVLLGRLQFAF